MPWRSPLSRFPFRRAHLVTLALVTVSLFALVAVGCSSSDDDGGDDGEALDAARTATREARRTATAEARAEETPTPRPTDTPDPEEADGDGDGLVDALDECPEAAESPVTGEGSNWDDDSDGCPDDIEDLVELGRSTVDFFWRAEFEAAGIEYVPPSQFTGYTEEIETACGTATLSNAFYCPRDHSIFYDIVFFEILLDRYGDYSPVFVIAHEWGHLVQGLLGRIGNDRFTIAVELEADCLAGAYTFDAEAQGILEEGDYQEALLTFFDVGDPLDSPVRDPQAHGTQGERTDAFNRGYEQGVATCLNFDFTPNR